MLVASGPGTPKLAITSDLEVTFRQFEGIQVPLKAGISWTWHCMHWVCSVVTQAQGGFCIVGYLLCLTLGPTSSRLRGALEKVCLIDRGTAMTASQQESYK